MKKINLYIIKKATLDLKINFFKLPIITKIVILYSLLNSIVYYAIYFQVLPFLLVLIPGVLLVQYYLRRVRLSNNTSIIKRIKENKLYYLSYFILIRISVFCVITLFTWIILLINTYGGFNFDLSFMIGSVWSKIGSAVLFSEIFIDITEYNIKMEISKLLNPEPSPNRPSGPSGSSGPSGDPGPSRPSGDTGPSGEGPSRPARGNQSEANPFSHCTRQDYEYLSKKIELQNWLTRNMFGINWRYNSTLYRDNFDWSLFKNPRFIAEHPHLVNVDPFFNEGELNLLHHMFRDRYINGREIINRHYGFKFDDQNRKFMYDKTLVDSGPAKPTVKMKTEIDTYTRERFGRVYVP